MAQNWLQHTLERTARQSSNQATALLVLGVTLGLIFGGVYLSQVASYATTNREIEELIAERDRLEFVNETLRTEIANLQTVPRLLARAQELGFQTAGPENLVYLVVDGYNPNRARTVVPLEDTADEFNTGPLYTETFSGWLQQQLDTLQQQFENFGQ